MTKKENIYKKHKTIKVDTETHKLLRIYAAENDLWLGEAIRDLLDKAGKKKDNFLTTNK